MPINDVMPDSAPIEADEYDEGSLQTPQDAPAPVPEPRTPLPTIPPPPPEDDGQPEFDQGDEPKADEKASEAGKELAARKKGLEGRKQTIQEQINALVRERGEVTRETERGRQERAELQREIETLRAEKTRGAQPAQAPPRQGQGQAYDGTDPRDPKPVEGNFDDYAAYTEAIGRWAGRAEFRRGEYLRQQRTEAGARQQWETTRQQAYATRYQAFAQANPTFEQEINREDLLLTAPMVDAIKDSELGPQMLLHLSRNSHEIDRISALHPVLAYGEMKKIEARLEGAHSGSPQPAQQHSKAPAPIRPVGNVASRQSDGNDIPDDDTDTDEHIRRMNQRDEMLRKRGVNTRTGYGVRV